jgi:sulfoxide reductase heme-binding subunit YedZ
VVVVGSTFTWYVVRAGGLVAFGLLTVTTVLGLLLSGRARLPDWPRFALEDVHRFAGLATGIFVGVHGLGLLVDDYLPFSLGQLLVPGAAPYRPLATALGVVAAELLLALALTNRFRDRLSYGFWRRAHYANFAVWALALVHGVTAGTDSRTAWALGLYAVAGATVSGLTVWRVLRARGLAPLMIRLWPGTAAVVTAELIVALALGPLGHRTR